MKKKLLMLPLILGSVAALGMIIDNGELIYTLIMIGVPAGLIIYFIRRRRKNVKKN